MEREVRYCTTEDGVRIAYCSQGEGPILLVCPLLFESFSFDQLLPPYNNLLLALSEELQLIRFDSRGTGLSQRDVEDFSQDAQVSDIEAVVRALGVKRISVLGWAGSGARATRYASKYPNRIERLILWTTFVRGLDALSEATFESLAHYAENNWPLAAQAIADLDTRDLSDMGIRLTEAYVKSTNGETAARIMREYVSADETGRLGAIRCPTLVMQRQNDPVFTLDHARNFAAKIPQARLISLSENVTPFTDWQPALQSILSFMAESRTTVRRSARPAGAGTRTVLFTDLVGHTEMMQRLGDARGRDVLREHERITRETLKQYGGAEVKTMGDGFMASFSSVTAAMECAIALQRAFAAHSESMPEPLHVRVGLNAGEPIEEDGDRR